MILGTLNGWHIHSKIYPEAFRRGMDFVLKQDCFALEPGTYPIDGENIFAIVQSGPAQPAEERFFEIHRRYLDIQVLLDGHEEQWFHLSLPELPVKEDRLDADDIAFYPDPPDPGRLLLTPGQYVIYAPGEQHKPFCKVSGSHGHLRKVVIKIDAGKLPAA